MASKQVAALSVGDQIPCVKTVMSVTTSAGQVQVAYDDGTTQTWDTAGDPSVEVLNG